MVQRKRMMTKVKLDYDVPKKIDARKVSKIKNLLDFNENFLEVRYSKKYKFFTIFFNNEVSGQKEIDSFTLSSTGCDLNFFEEFVDSCVNYPFGALINNDDSQNTSFCCLLTDEEVVNKSKQLFNELRKVVTKQQQLQKFITDTQKKLKATLLSQIQNSKSYTPTNDLAPCFVH